MVHVFAEATEEQSARKQRKRQGKTEQILDAAMRLVVEEGIEALTVQRLARELDAAVGAVYRYFPSKEAILFALQARGLEAFGKELGQARLVLGEAPERALERLALAAALYWRMPERAPAHFELIGRMVAEPRELLPPELAGPNVKAALEIFEPIGRDFEQAAELGLLAAGDSWRRVLTLWSGLHGLLQMRKLGRFLPEPLRQAEAWRETWRDLGTDLLRTMLRGWGAEPERIEAALEHCQTEAWGA